MMPHSPTSLQAALEIHVIAARYKTAILQETELL
jgi:hypothetical protein